jgi:hypothetical protein
MSGSDQASTIAADLLFGAEEIAAELKQLGIIDEADDGDKLLDKVYYLARSKKLPISKFGKGLIASRAKLRRAVLNLVA